MEENNPEHNTTVKQLIKACRLIRETLGSFKEISILNPADLYEGVKFKHNWLFYWQASGFTDSGKYFYVLIYKHKESKTAEIEIAHTTDDEPRELLIEAFTGKNLPVSAQVEIKTTTTKQIR